MKIKDCYFSLPEQSEAYCFPKSHDRSVIIVKTPGFHSCFQACQIMACPGRTGLRNKAFKAVTSTIIGKLEMKQRILHIINQDERMVAGI